MYFKQQNNTTELTDKQTNKSIFHFTPLQHIHKRINEEKQLRTNSPDRALHGQHKRVPIRTVSLSQQYFSRLILQMYSTFIATSIQGEAVTLTNVLSFSSFRRRELFVTNRTAQMRIPDRKHVAPFHLFALNEIHFVSGSVCVSCLSLICHVVMAQGREGECEWHRDVAHANVCQVLFRLTRTTFPREHLF